MIYGYKVTKTNLTIPKQCSRCGGVPEIGVRLVAEGRGGDQRNFLSCRRCAQQAIKEMPPSHWLDIVPILRKGVPQDGEVRRKFKVLRLHQKSNSGKLEVLLHDIPEMIHAKVSVRYDAIPPGWREVGQVFELCGPPLNLRLFENSGLNSK